MHIYTIEKRSFLAEVTMVTWHMHHYGAASPKPHYAFANSRSIAGLWKGKLTGWRNHKKSLGKSHKTTCEVYMDTKGYKRWKGTKRLRATEILDRSGFIHHMCRHIYIYMHIERERVRERLFYRIPRGWFPRGWLSLVQTVVEILTSVWDMIWTKSPIHHVGFHLKTPMSCYTR